MARNKEGLDTPAIREARNFADHYLRVLQQAEIREQRKHKGQT